MTESSKIDDLQAAMAQVEGMMNMIDATAMVRQTTAAYREQLVDDSGFSEAIAEQMSIEFHAMMMDMFRHKLQESLAQAASNRGRGTNRAQRRRQG